MFLYYRCEFLKGGFIDPVTAKDTIVANDIIMAKDSIVENDIIAAEIQLQIITQSGLLPLA